MSSTPPTVKPLFRLAQILDRFLHTYADRRAFFVAFDYGVRVLDQGSSIAQITNALQLIDDQDPYALREICVLVCDGQTTIAVGGNIQRELSELETRFKARPNPEVAPVIVEPPPDPTPVYTPPAADPPRRVRRSVVKPPPVVVEAPPVEAEAEPETLVAFETVFGEMDEAVPEAMLLTAAPFPLFPKQGNGARAERRAWDGGVLLPLWWQS